MASLRARKLTKKPGDFTAVDEVSFGLESGEIVGLLGPNGAGKTATINVRILFLDELTTGIDVASARQIRRLIVDMNKKGTTVLLTTHYNVNRFPMLFLCGLFIPISQLPVVLRPLSYGVPLTYRVDLLKRAISDDGYIAPFISIAVLPGFVVLLFTLSMRNVQKRWIA